MLRLMPSRIFGSLKQMADHSTLRLVLFRLGPLSCAVPAGMVREVIPVDRAVRIPGAAAAISGLVNLRGTLLTVVDGRRALGVSDASAPESVLVVDRGTVAIGLAVDEVEDLVEVDAAALVSGNAMPGVDPRVVASVGERAGRVFAVLDIEALVAPHLG